MAIPRKIGLPTKPPSNQGNNNPPQKPVNAPVSEQNRPDEQSPRPRVKTSQNSAKRVMTSEDEKKQQSSLNDRNARSPRKSQQNSSASGRKKQKIVSTPKEEIKETPEVEEGYAIDEETGIKYRLLPGAKPEAVKKFNSMKKADLENLTFSSMKYFFTEAEDFDVEDLNSAADDFLGHLRVPPNKEEQKRLREERAQRKRLQNQKFEEEQERLTAKYGSLEPDDIDDV